MAASPERWTGHPYRTLAVAPAECREADGGDTFRATLKACLAGVVLLRVCVDVAFGDVSPGGVVAFVALCLAFTWEWV